MSRQPVKREAVFDALQRHGPMTTPDLARAVRMEPSTVHGALQHLLAAGRIQVKRGKCKVLENGPPVQQPNVWRVKPLINKNIGRTANSSSSEVANDPIITSERTQVTPLENCA